MEETQETWAQFLPGEVPLEEEMVTHSNILVHGNPMERRAWCATNKKKNYDTLFEVFLSFQYFIFRSEVSLITSLM